jgi:hypothetical protein
MERKSINTKLHTTVSIHNPLVYNVEPLLVSSVIGHHPLIVTWNLKVGQVNHGMSNLTHIAMEG